MRRAILAALAVLTVAGCEAESGGDFCAGADVVQGNFRWADVERTSVGRVAAVERWGYLWHEMSLAAAVGGECDPPCATISYEETAFRVEDMQGVSVCIRLRCPVDGRSERAALCESPCSECPAQ